MVGSCQDNWILFSTVSSGLSVTISTVGFSLLPLQWLPRTTFPRVKQPERESNHRRLPLKSVSTSQYEATEPRQCSSWFAFHRRWVQISAGAQGIVTELIAVFPALRGKFSYISSVRPGLHKSTVTKFCAVAPCVCGFSMWSWDHETVLTPGILRLLPDSFFSFWKICSPLS